jgi:hypothetical protein
MKRLCVVVALVIGLVAVPAEAKVIDIGASPNPANLRDRVRHTIDIGTSGRLDVWVSASGFEAPGSGTLPPGAWSYECCPSQTAGTPAWHFRSIAPVAGSFRFNAVARLRGTFLSTASVPGGVSSVWIVIR